MKASIAVKLLVLGLGTFLFAGCAIIPHVGIIYSDATAPIRYNPAENQNYLKGRNYEVLGPVRGEASVENYLGWVAMGDYGVIAAYKDAMKKKRGADLLIDMRVDRHTMRVLGFYIKATTIVTGTAVKITGGGESGPTPGSSPPAGGEKKPAAAANSGGKKLGESKGGESWWGK